MKPDYVALAQELNEILKPTRLFTATHIANKNGILLSSRYGTPFGLVVSGDIWAYLMLENEEWIPRPLVARSAQPLEIVALEVASYFGVVLNGMVGRAQGLLDITRKHPLFLDDCKTLLSWIAAMVNYPDEDVSDFAFERFKSLASKMGPWLFENEST